MGVGVGVGVYKKFVTGSGSGPGREWEWECGRYGHGQWAGTVPYVSIFSLSSFLLSKLFPLRHFNDTFIECPPIDPTSPNPHPHSTSTLSFPLPVKM